MLGLLPWRIKSYILYTMEQNSYKRNEKIVFACLYDFQQMFFSKDVFLIPYYVAKQKGLSLLCYYGVNKGSTTIVSEHRGAKIIGGRWKRTTVLTELLDTIIQIVPRARKIDTLFVVGISTVHLLRVWVFKMINPKAHVIVFGDMEPKQAQQIVETNFYQSKTPGNFIKQRLADFFFRHTLFCVANCEAFETIKEIYEKRHWKGLLHYYPLLDDEAFAQYGMKRLSWEEKDNIMVCVGRIGNKQKNTEMLLSALEKVDLKDWKIYMLGPVTSSFDLNEKGDFQKIIDDFFQRNPQHKEKLIFTGIIYDQKVIFDYYNRAKVLLMTSRHESWGNVYSEAAALGCYIISTDVGGATLCSNNWQFGTKIEQEDSTGLAKVLQDMVDGNLKIDTSKAISLEDMCYSTQTQKNLSLVYE